MAVRDFNDLLSQIDLIIVENDVRAITPTVHNPLLKDISDTLKAISGNYVDLVEDTANEYSGTPASALNAYETGTRFVVKVDTTNTGSVKFAISGLAQRDVKKQSGASLIALSANDLRAGIYYECIITETEIQLLPSQAAAGGGGGDMLAANNLSDVANAATSFDNIKQAATTTTTGVVELATDGEAVAGKVVQGNDSRLGDDLPRVLEIKNQALPYTVLDADNGKHVELSGSGAITIPNGLAVGGQFSIGIVNASPQTLSLGGSVTLRTPNIATSSISGEGVVSIAVIDSNLIRLAGNTE